MKTTIEISDGLFAEARECARRRGVPFRSVVEEGLRSVVQRDSVGAAAFRLRDASFGVEVITPELDWSDVRQLIYEGRGE